MTERAIAFPLPDRREPARREPTTPLAVVPAARAATRPAVAARRPIHVAVTVGVTAGLYAVSLAGVTAMQANTDRQIAADRAPAAAAIEALRANHDAVEAELARIDAGYATMAASYQAIVDGITVHETALGALGEQVTAIEGSAKALKVPTVRSLPSVSSRTVYVRSKPAANACTKASGC
jgi:hypothetical protein